MNPNRTADIQPDRDQLIALRLQAKNLPLRPQQKARSVTAGNYRSVFRGRGMDYAESRGYQAGDDVRNMDWRVTARSGRAHIKVYQEERERPVVIMADFGPGMFFATQGAFKSIIVARAAALIAWAAVQQGDRVGALLYNGQHHELRPTRGQRGALQLINALVEFADPAHASDNPQAGSDRFGAALQRLRRVVRPGSLVFLFSDFYQPGNDSKRHLQLLRRHNDVIACQVLDRLERQAPVPGRYPIIAGSRRGMLDARSAVQRAAWTRHFAERHAQVSELMRQCTIPLLQLGTADDVGQRLREILLRPATVEQHVA